MSEDLLLETIKGDAAPVSGVLIRGKQVCYFVDGYRCTAKKFIESTGHVLARFTDDESLAVSVGRLFDQGATER